MPKLSVGDRVQLVRDVDRFPVFIAREGAVGTVTVASEKAVAVRLDGALPGAEEWDNCVCWVPEYGDPLNDLKVLAGARELDHHDRGMIEEAIDEALNTLGANLATRFVDCESGDESPEMVVRVRSALREYAEAWISLNSPTGRS